MILKHRVGLNGVWLDEVDDRIITVAIDEQPAKLNVGTANLMGPYGGQTALSTHRDKLDVNIRYQIRRTDWAERDKVIDNVNAWAAAGGWMTLNYKEGKRLWVQCTALSESKDPSKWNEDLTLTLTAFDVPYWQDEAPVKVEELNTASVTKRMVINGTAGSVLDAEVKNVSGSGINTVSLTAAGRTMAFSGLGMANNETLIINHTEKGRLQLRIKNRNGVYRSVMDKRTQESDDELYVQPGAVNITFTAGGACRLTLSNTGRYL